MRNTLPPREPLFRKPSAASVGALAPLILFGLVLVGLAFMISLLPHDVVLPVFSVVALAGAALVAIAALVLPRFAALKPIGPWDIAGALTLIGCAAAILGEIEPLIEYLKPVPERSPARD